MSLTIDFFGEISCPWCLVAQHRLDNVLEREFPGLEVEIRHHPLILSAGMDGQRPADLMRTRYGITDLAAAFARPEAEARSAGVPLSLANQPRAFDTTPAHTVIRHAAGRGTQHALASALTDAYFLGGVEMGDLDAVAGIAASHGFSHEEALGLMGDADELELTARASAQARERGVKSVPLIVLPDGTALQTCPEETLADAIACCCPRMIGQDQTDCWDAMNSRGER